MALSPEVVDLVGFDIVDEVGDLLVVREVAVVEKETGIGIVGVSINMVNPGSVEGRCPPDDSVYFIPLMEEEFC